MKRRDYADVNPVPDFEGLGLIDYGDLVWGDYEMCFPLADLYDGGI